jgi:hypothetical protein
MLVSACETPLEPTPILIPPGSDRPGEPESDEGSNETDASKGRLGSAGTPAVSYLTREPYVSVRNR